jgi:hypothetical protein
MKYLKGTVKCRDGVRRNVFGSISIKDYWYMRKLKKWVHKDDVKHDEDGYLVNSITTSYFDCKSLRAFRKYVKKHIEIRVGTKVILESNMNGIDNIVLWRR